MGGKGAIIIDETADLDAALAAVIPSAFGYQGQKCSAASRLIVIREVYQTVLERLLTAVKALSLGPAETNHHLNAVISDTQFHMILSEIAQGRQEAKLLTGGRPVDLDGGYYISPAVFAPVPPECPSGSARNFRAGAGGHPGEGF